jgi:hypothetical protein
MQLDVGCLGMRAGKRSERKTKMVEKWALKVKPEDFAERIWQTEDVFTSEELNCVLQEWNDMVQDILICLSEGKTVSEIMDKLDWDYCRLGDLSNFLENIRIVVTPDPN